MTVLVTEKQNELSGPAPGPALSRESHWLQLGTAESRGGCTILVKVKVLEITVKTASFKTAAPPEDPDGGRALGTMACKLKCLGRIMLEMGRAGTEMTKNPQKDESPLQLVTAPLLDICGFLFKITVFIPPTPDF